MPVAIGVGLSLTKLPGVGDTPPPPVEEPALLLESGDTLLLESGDRLLLE